MDIDQILMLAARQHSQTTAHKLVTNHPGTSCGINFTNVMPALLTLAEMPCKSGHVGFPRYQDPHTAGQLHTCTGA